MYAKFYKLRKEPFNVTPDPTFLYLSSSHKEAIAALLYGIKSRKGFIAILGEVGTGKTTIVRTYLNSINKSSIKLIYLFNPNLTFNALLRDLLAEFDVKPASDESNKMIAQLHRCLIDQYRKGRNVTLIIDEAQNMPLPTLESLRMLSNLETTREKLLQIVLVGQPELETMLARHELRQLRNRIAILAKIHPLSERESIDYIQNRVDKVSMKKNNRLFTNDALRLIVKRAQGIPRTINILCDNTLVTGYGYQSSYSLVSWRGSFSWKGDRSMT
jgi:general secretion pathway protein A